MKMLHHYENQVISFAIFIIIYQSKLVQAQAHQRQDYETNKGVGSSELGVEGSGEVMAPRGAPIINSHEPSCEELRAMWRFSKRQSRASEITNEIPTYRDPFSYNVWEPYYPTTRSMGGMRISSRYRDPARPVYGRVINKEPVVRYREMPERNRALEEVTRMYGAENKGNSAIAATQRRRVTQYRSGQNSIIPQRGSFNVLKELVWTERAKELAQQRRAEEMAARAAVLKEIANGQSFISPRYRQQMSPNQLEENLNMQPIQQQQQQQQQQQKQPSNGGMDFPNLLAPSGGQSSMDNLQGFGNYKNKNSYSKYNGGDSDDESSLFSSPSYLIKPQGKSHFRERNRAHLRHGFPDMNYNGSPRTQPASLSGLINF